MLVDRIFNFVAWFTSLLYCRSWLHIVLRNSCIVQWFKSFCLGLLYKFYDLVFYNVILTQFCYYIGIN